jgi:hypothetical protein
MTVPRLSPQPTKGAFAGDPKLAGVVAASRLLRPPAPVVSCGIAEVDALTGGLPRGALTEICGPASSGRTSLLLAALAEATRRQEVCALVDTSDAFDPPSAAAAGVDLQRLLWVRCGGAMPKASSLWLRRLEQTLKTTDLLLHGGGFGLVAVDMSDVPAEYARRVPLSSWFRFRRAIEHTRVVLLVLEQEPYAKTCASLVLKTAALGAQPNPGSMVDPKLSTVRRTVPEAADVPAHGQLFQGINVQVAVVRVGVDVKKPAGRVHASFTAEAKVG